MSESEQIQVLNKKVRKLERENQLRFVITILTIVGVTAYLSANIQKLVKLI